MKPLVSIYCFCYNHAKYIRDALEGFVNQKTSFPYEVIVHDDASTDESQQIIREYADKYPDIIKPILQTENQYSQGKKLFNTFIVPEIKGKYLAACEGDDYWCDDLKLQRQVDWLEDHSDYSLCVHNTKKINCATGMEDYINDGREDRDISTEEIIRWKGNLFQTSGIMYRAEYALVPTVFSLPGVGDYPRAIYLAVSGKVRYLHDVMSVYRYLVPGSWSMRTNQSEESAERKITHWQHRIAMLKRVNEYTEGKYEDCIRDVIRRNEFNICYARYDLKTIRKSYSDFYKQESVKGKALLYIGFYCPVLLKIYQRIRNH